MTFIDLIKNTLLGYVLIGLLAFAFGVTVTLGCIHLIKMRNADTEKKDNGI